MSRINSKGIEIIKKFEGLKLTAYLCPSGIWTIGYGHTKGVMAGDVLTINEAEGLLKVDLIEVEKAIESAIRIPLTSNQFSALASFTFNVGTFAFKNSTLLRLLNQKQFAAASEQFGRWIKDGKGRALKGLVLRRESEKKLFLS